jgi:type II secretory pathway pseudopilin PulG
MIYHGKRRHAFTLVEILTVMFGLGVAMALGTVILAGMLRIQKASQLSLERTFARSALADQFRTDVAASRALVKGLGDFHSSESCLILRGKSGCIVYRFQEGRVERLDMSMDGTVRHRALLGPQAERVCFISQGRKPLIAMSLEQSTDKPHDRRTWLYQAALGGDWR